MGFIESDFDFSGNSTKHATSSIRSYNIKISMPFIMVLVWAHLNYVGSVEKCCLGIVCKKKSLIQS